MEDLGSYRLLGEIGRGASGIVYRARHRPLGRIVAPEVLQAHDCGRVLEDETQLLRSDASEVRSRLAFLLRISRFDPGPLPQSWAYWVDLGR